MLKWLVIGYGNELRGDDAVGPQIAREVASWNLEGVEALALHQLTPELAEPLSLCAQALFVDASVDVADVDTAKLSPAEALATSGHTSDPRGLLTLARLLYGHCPRACWLLRVPARGFDLGAELSPCAQRGKALALEQIRQRLPG